MAYTQGLWFLKLTNFMNLSKTFLSETSFYYCDYMPMKNKMTSIKSGASCLIHANEHH